MVVILASFEKLESSMASKLPGIWTISSSDPSSRDKHNFPLYRLVSIDSIVGVATTREILMAFHRTSPLCAEILGIPFESRKRT